MARTPTLLLSLLLLAALPACDMPVAEREREHEAEIARLRAEKAQAQEEARRLREQLKEMQARIDAMLVQLANANDEATRASLQKQLDEAKREAERLGGRKPDKPACKCNPADPLCTCL
jgi:septal ring factor EnvC (AmiA/AmiB activator)